MTIHCESCKTPCQFRIDGGSCDGEQMEYIGIDPGKNGAIVIIGNDSIEIHVMPKIGNELDLRALSMILRAYSRPDVYCCLEHVHAIHGVGAGTTFTFGGVFYAAQMGLVDYEIPYTLVQPKKWQKEMYQSIPEIRKPPIRIKTDTRAGQIMKGKRDCKSMSLLATKRLFPTVDLRASERCKKPHDGIVDALLIAEYCRRLNK